MPEVAAVSALGVTVVLVLTRPQIGRHLRVGPATAAAIGVLIMLLAGHVTPADTVVALEVLWRPFVTITAIMVIASVVNYLGVVDRLASMIIPLAGGSTTRLYLLVFFLGAATAATLNNDAAILVLTPLVVVLIRRLYPDHPALLVPFVFAIFMAAGVAPLVTSNPMNLIVADVAGLDFNSYAVQMVPVALSGALVTFGVLRWFFRRELAAAPLPDPAVAAATRTRWTSAERHGLILMLTVLGAYPLVSYFDGSVWLVSVTGAVIGIGLCWRHGVVSVAELARKGVSWEILIFLLGLFTLAIGLRNAGAVDWLTELYTGANVGVVAAVSAVGSALINNHSMALTNVLAIEAVPGTNEQALLAALIGGDLGPRLLPMGSLAGLLWLASLKQLGVKVTIRQFVTIGTLTAIPAIAVSVVVLILL